MPLGECLGEGAAPAYKLLLARGRVPHQDDAWAIRPLANCPRQAARLATPHKERQFTFPGRLFGIFSSSPFHSMIGNAETDIEGSKSNVADCEPGPGQP